MIRIIAERIVQKEQIDAVRQLYLELGQWSRSEPGCISYELCQSQETPEMFFVIETWASQAALDAHRLTEHFTRIVPQIAEKSAQGRATACSILST